tara:strand:+ start:1563 stop:1943 length:381 start_codon:yes stop_codon:yes gene_type:complete
MAHYVVLDSNNIVVDGFVGRNEGEDGVDWEQYYSAKRTSYNTRGGVHYDPDTNEPSVDQSKAFRKNYAGLGYTYDEARDAFIPPKPFPSWTLNESTCLWNAPVPYPDDNQMYLWNEETQQWDVVDN